MIDVEQVLCESCAAKPGAPDLCLPCLANRERFGVLNRAVRELTNRCEDLAIANTSGVRLSTCAHSQPPRSTR